MVDYRVLIPGWLDPDRLTPPDAQSGVEQLAGDTMGTSWSLSLVRPAGLALDTVRSGLEAVFSAIIAQMSPWERESELARFNTAPAGTAFVLSPEFAEVLGAALRLAHGTGGAFDPALGALSDLWGFGPPGPVSKPPGKNAMRASAATSGWQDIVFHPDTGVAIQPGRVKLDLCGIAKGYAVDRGASVLDELGVSSFLLEIGGELRGQGVKPDGLPWWVKLDDPPGCNTTPVLAALHGVSVASSGDYQRFFEHAGTRYAHTFDPAAKRPSMHGMAGISVIHTSCMMADALATAFGAMPPDAAMAYARSRTIAARFVVRTPAGLKECLSPAFEALLQ